MEKRSKTIVIVGPTASGKTTLSITLAKQFNGEIVSADSRQVYRELDIGTGKVTKEEMGSVPHHLLDVADPMITYTVADVVRDGRRAINDILSRGKIPIVVGGTFFYIDALLGRVVAPEVLPNPKLRAELEKRTTEELFSMLAARDERRADDIDKHNKRRLIRALEIVEAVGSVPERMSDELYDVFMLGISISKDDLRANIHTRLLSRLENGMLDEAKRLLKDGVTHERLESLGLEYRYMSHHLQGQMSYEEMVNKLEMKIWQYTKRQMTWLKRDKDIVWIKIDKIEGIEKRVDLFLKTVATYSS
jgi:tRNA dimethylallyltransferase